MTDLAALYSDHLAALETGTAAALAATGFDAVVLSSGRAASKNRFDDQHHALSPTPSLLHFVPATEANAYLIVAPGKRSTLHRTAVDDFWHAAPHLDTAHCASAVDETQRQAGVPLPLPPGRVAIISRDDDDNAAPSAVMNPPELIAALDALRLHKSPYELYCLRLAAARAVRGHLAARNAFLAGDARGPSELALHLAYLAGSEQDDSSAPYQGIVALGANAAILHYTQYQTTAPGADNTSLLVDAGARHLCYGSDITRTHVRGTSAAAKRFADLIVRMDELQLGLCDEVRPGVDYEDLHELAHIRLAELGRATGIMRGGTEELVETGVTRAFLPHGLGHSLGIVTHDVGGKPRPPRARNPFLRMTIKLEVGHVVTIEPGIYFVESLLAPLRNGPQAHSVDWDAVAELAPFGGIRIEDDVVVCAPGESPENLSRDAFSAAE